MAILNHLGVRSQCIFEMVTDTNRKKKPEKSIVNQSLSRDI
jgi:hypothetical protein